MTSPKPTPGKTGRFAQASLDHTLMDTKGVGANLISQTYHLFQNELSTVGSAFFLKKKKGSWLTLLAKKLHFLIWFIHWH